MAKITRATQLLFAFSAGGSDVGEFGSKAAGSPDYTSNPATIQALPAFLTGLAAAVDTNQRPYLEDHNALFLLAFRQIAYLLQAGIPEYDPATTYYQNSYCQVSGVVYYSLVDGNIGNAPASSPSAWARGVLGTAEVSGTIKMFGGASAPTGFLICDGSSLLRASYATLFTAIGTAFGTADSTHFNLPDFRGIFPRGVDNGAGNDPDTATRTAAKAGGNSGDNVGSAQTDQIAAHEHTIGTEDTVQQGTGSSPQVADIAPNTGLSSGSAGGSETRPKNVYVNFIIKT